MDGEDLITAAPEEGVVAGREIANRGRCRGRLRLERGQSLVKLLAGDISSVDIFFSIDDQKAGNDFQLMLFDQNLRYVASGISDNAKLHDCGFSRSSQSSRYLRFQSMRKRKAITGPQASAIQNSIPRRLRSQKSGAMRMPVNTVAR